MPERGEKAPDAVLHTAQGPVSLGSLWGQGPLVLVFYTEADTPSCNQQLCAFRDEDATLRELGARVVAVSADPPERHEALREKLGLPFTLAADPHLEAARAFGVASDDGRRSRRAVFVIGQDGTVLHAIPWYNPGNTAQFLEVFQALGLG